MVAEAIQIPLPNRPEPSPVLPAVEAPEKQTRIISTIEFPYSDLETTLQIVNAINSKAGTECDLDQLAGWMQMTPTSGTFKQRVSAARMFGLARRDGNRVRLTQLGRDTLDPSKVRNARAESFLSVELYKAIYNKYRGTVLPPVAGLEAEIASLGVSPNQKERARWAFEKSAEFAGFFESGRDRLVSPSVRSAPLVEASETAAPDNPGTGQAPIVSPREPQSSEQHPFIQGLLRALPAPDTLWAIEGRAKWLQAAAHIFDLMYKGDGQITVAIDKLSRGGQDDTSR